MSKHTIGPLVEIGDGLYPLDKIVSIRRERYCPRTCLEISMIDGTVFVEHAKYDDARAAYNAARAESDRETP